MYILIAAVVLLLALLAVKFSNRYGIPSFLLFIILGISFNFFGKDFNNYRFVDEFSSVALLIIMFYGGFGTNLQMAKSVTTQGVIMASAGVVLTSILTGAFCYFVLKISFVESMLLGSVVGSTDFASVSSILRSKNLNLKYSTASMLEIESGSNDPTAYTMTMIFLSILMGSKTSVFKLILLQVGIGLLVGFLMAKLTEKLIFKIDFSQDGLFTVLIISCALLTFAISKNLGGNAFLSVYVLGIMIGNLEYYRKKEVVFFFDGFSGIMQIGLFFLLGLLADPKSIVKAVPVAFLVMVFITIIARPLASILLLKPFGYKKNQLIVISAAGFRGAAAIAFAIMVINSNAKLSVDLFHIIFVICLLSCLIQGSLFPIICKKTDMIDPDDTVLKTFNYYSSKSDVGFIETKINEHSELVGKKVSEIGLHFDIIVAKIIRDNKLVVPRGDTVICADDTVVIGGKSYFDPTGYGLVEITISDKNNWNGKKLKDIDMIDSELVVMIQSKNGEIIVPSGNVTLNVGDKLIILKETVRL